ncbi:MAG: hypothetical protein Q4F38_06110 [Akkermansia sp.]|nr:hypothetical protein [Akkermansia sp.]
MNKRTLSLVLALLSCGMLSSCIHQIFIQKFTRDEYPGTRPPMVIPDAGGKPAHTNWQKEDEFMLPPSSHLTRKIDTASDGIPYGLPSEFSNIITSPHAPHYLLDYTGIPVGSKVWDPYTRKPFYISRTYTFN